ncbi:hypothetical protein IWQ60_008766 [Tieghemiomyces parasiticus]|uniref:Uncharacterized protein n=1 Tax=Tieghemiomyces parasiticus TaxID=78921 RepID=A0A9W7ZWG9_9FUNG|nr:hypothetical protein IWQ60_008766 [Tieghemiomyces parasiticus]
MSRMTRNTDARQGRHVPTEHERLRGAISVPVQTWDRQWVTSGTDDKVQAPRIPYKVYTWAKGSRAPQFPSHAFDDSDEELQRLNAEREAAEKETVKLGDIVIPDLDELAGEAPATRDPNAQSVPAPAEGDEDHDMETDSTPADAQTAADVQLDADAPQASSHLPSASLSPAAADAAATITETLAVEAGITANNDFASESDPAPSEPAVTTCALGSNDDAPTSDAMETDS